MALKNVMRVDGGNVIDGTMPQTYPASNVMMSDGETSVEEAISDVDTYELTLPGFELPFVFQKVGRIVYLTYISNATNVPAGALTFTQTLPEKYRPIINIQIATNSSNPTRVAIHLSSSGSITGYNYGSAISSRTSCRFGTVAYVANS